MNKVGIVEEIQALGEKGRSERIACPFAACWNKKVVHREQPKDKFKSINAHRETLNLEHITLHKAYVEQTIVSAGGAVSLSGHKTPVPPKTLPL